MGIKNFVSGNYKEHYKYKSFMSNPINIEWTISDNTLINLLSLVDIKLTQKFIHYLYSKPIVDSFEISKELSINPSTSLRVI